MRTGMTPSVLGIASFYRQNNIDLSQTLLRLASGRKINYPSDDATNYMRAKSLSSQASHYEKITSELIQWEKAMNVASAASGEILDNLNRMKELIYLAGQTTVQEEKDAYQSEFYQLAVANRSMVQNVNWQGASLLNNAGTIATINLAPDSSSYTITLAPGVAIAPENLNPLIENTAAYQINDTAQDRAAAQGLVDNALNQIKPFISTISGYARTLQSQQNVNSAIIENLRGAESAIMEINEAQEMIALTAQNIRRQASIAMLAQANVASSHIMLLYGLKQGG